MQIGKRAMTALLGVSVSVTLLGASLTGCNLDTDQRFEQQDSTDSGPRGTSSLTGPDPSTGVHLPEVP